MEDRHLKREIHKKLKKKESLAKIRMNPLEKMENPVNVQNHEVLLNVSYHWIDPI